MYGKEDLKIGKIMKNLTSRYASLYYTYLIVEKTNNGSNGSASSDHLFTKTKHNLNKVVLLLIKLLFEFNQNEQ